MNPGAVRSKSVVRPLPQSEREGEGAATFAEPLCCSRSLEGIEWSSNVWFQLVGVKSGRVILRYTYEQLLDLWVRAVHTVVDSFTVASGNQLLEISV